MAAGRGTAYVLALLNALVAVLAAFGWTPVTPIPASALTVIAGALATGFAALAHWWPTARSAATKGPTMTALPLPGRRALLAILQGPVLGRAEARDFALAGLPSDARAMIPRSSAAAMDWAAIVDMLLAYGGTPPILAAFLDNLQDYVGESDTGRALLAWRQAWRI